MPTFNSEQRAAIEARNPYLLCAAGAGSGKTTVMVESVAQKLKENLSKDISTFLIITFTNEAAANMKRKVQERLTGEARKGEAWAARGLANLENATISTIHAFCKGLISSYFYAIDGMSPKFEIIEEARLEQLFREAYETALDDICDPDQTAWTKEQVTLVREVMNAFRQAELVPLCRELYQALMGIPDPFERLDGYIDAISAPLEQNAWAREVLFAVDMNLLGLEDFLLREQALLGPVTPPQCQDAAETDAEAIRALLDTLRQEGLTVQQRLDAVLAAKNAMPTVRLTKKDGDAAREWNEGFKALRAGVKGSGGVLDTAAKSLQSLLKPSQAADNLRLQQTLRGIAILLRATSDRFRQLKLAAQGIDYADMEQMAYELVQRPEIREAVIAAYSDIYVDECQDVSAIQYAILQALTGGEGRSVVRVGDIKQSIYGFRSAAPDLMDRDIHAYSAAEDAPKRKIFFQQNYRSCARVIACVNEVFDACMDRRVSEIDYTPEDHLQANAEGDFGPVKVILLDRDSDEESQRNEAASAEQSEASELPASSAVQSEASALFPAPSAGQSAASEPPAAAAKQSVASELPSASLSQQSEAAQPRSEAENEQNKTPARSAQGAPEGRRTEDMLEAQCYAAGREIEDQVLRRGRAYRDIVILVQNARSDAPVMVEHFRRMHIPVLYDGGQTFYGLTEISSFLSLLTVIDNDHTDVELVGTLRNAPFHFSETDLAQIRRSHMDPSWFYEAFLACCERGETDLDRRCRAARQQILTWRERARVMSVSEFIWQLLRESGIYAVRGAYPDGRLRQLNLDSLYQRAVELEKRGIFRLSDFLWEISRLRASGGADSGDTPAALGEGDNFVRLMTMHKSKGLEFPVVILMNLQKNLRRSPARGKMKLCVGTGEEANAPLGVYVPVISRRSHTKRDTWGLEAFKVREIRTSIAEDTRLLYVAMTRAMQNLILIGHFRRRETDLWQEKTKVSRIWKTRSMLDLIMPAVLAQLSGNERDSSTKNEQISLSAGEQAEGPASTANGEAGSMVQPEASAAASSEAGTVTQPDTSDSASSEAASPSRLAEVPQVGTVLQGGNWLLSVQPPQPIQSDESPMSESQLDATVSAIVQSEEASPAAMWQPEEPDPSPLKTSVTSLLLSGRQVTPDPEFTAPAPARVSVSVSETVPGFVPEEEETVDTKRRPELPGFLLSPIPPRPAFMEEQHANAAEFGTQTHRFLRLIDLSAFRGHYTFEYKKLIEAEIVRMRDHAILSETEAASVFRNGILGFLMSPLGQRMLASPRVEREWPFTMQLRSDSPTMVQGIVDAAFLENDQWILLDYKTDKDTREGVFVPRHEKQMNWYRVAIERLTGLPVKEMWLYALRSSKAYQVRNLPL